jgi:class 3 adenylate cyclase
MSETRKIAAILVADVVGYSRLPGTDEEGTFARLRALDTDLIDPAVAAHHGRILAARMDQRITIPDAQSGAPPIDIEITEMLAVSRLWPKRRDDAAQPIQ